MNNFLQIAQGVSDLQDPAIPEWIVIVVAIIALGLILWGSFMSAKRTHQD
ncbi:hypothetical protein [Mucisphaera sp.]